MLQLVHHKTAMVLVMLLLPAALFRISGCLPRQPLFDTFVPAHILVTQTSRLRQQYLQNGLALQQFLLVLSTKYQIAPT